MFHPARKRRSANFRFIALPLFLFLAAGGFRLYAQDVVPTAVTDQNRTGDLPFSSTVGTDLEHVVIASGDLIVNIPIAHIKGRAGLGFDFGLRYDGHILVQSVLGGPPVNQNVWTFQAHDYVPAGGIWQTNQPTLSFQDYTRTACFGGLGGSGTATDQNGFILQDAQGAQHSLNASYEQAECPGGSWSFRNSGADRDDSGIWAQFSTTGVPRLASVLFANGTAFGGSGVVTTVNTPPNTVLEVGGLYVDSNGNSTNNYPGGDDSLGRVMVTQTSGTNSITYTVHASDGSSQNYTVNYSNISIQTNFGFGTDYKNSRPAISSIVLPNGKSYAFTYDSYGSLTGISLPTGGTISYTWANFGSGMAIYRYVASRTVSINGVNSTWTFSRQAPTSGTKCPNDFSCPSAVTTMTDPMNNQTMYMSGNGGIDVVQFYNGAPTGTPVRQVSVAYTQFLDNSQLPGQVITQLDNGLVSETDYTYDTFNYSQSDCPSDIVCEESGVSTGPRTTSRGDVKEIDEYDWGSGSHGPLLRKILKSYLHEQNSAYAAPATNIVDKVLTDTTQDGSGNQVAQTQYVYDNYTGAAAMVSSGGAPEHSSNYGTGFTLRGNATQVERWRNTDGALLTTTYTYDDLGNIRTITDPLNHATNRSYSDSWANSSCAPPSNSLAYPTQMTNALGKETQVTYFPCTGLTQAQKDQNDINAATAGTTFTYDFMNRLLSKTNPDGGQVGNTYNDTPPVSVTTASSITSSANLTSTALKDGLGRTIQTQLTSDPQGTDFTVTTYDGLGRVASVTNPYRSGDTIYTTSYAYDVLNRTTQVTETDGSVINTAYSGNCTTVTDEAGNSRQSCVDGLGRMTSVIEDPGSSPHLNYTTTYGYDALDNLLSVLQNGSRPRNFTYNSLSQLTQAVNPESGTINYGYDTDGNLTSKIAPAPNQTGTNTVTTTYSYDVLNRLTEKQYNDGSTKTIYFNYDGTTQPPNCTASITDSNPIGLRTGMCDAVGSEAWSHDSMGRTLTDQRTTVAGTTLTQTFSYTYNLAGSVTNLAYPSGLSLTYTYDGVGRPANVKDQNGNTYAAGSCGTAGVCYTAAGATQTATLDATANFAGFTIANSYNPRLQPSELKIPGGGSTFMDYSYCFYALASGACPATGTTDNGNVMAIFDGVTSRRSATTR